MAISETRSTIGSNGPKDQASMPPGPPHHVTILHMHAIYSQSQLIHTQKWI